MRTAEEHYQIATLKNLSNPNGTRMDVILSAINEARKEAIEECALFIEMKALKTREEITPKEYIDLVRSLINEIK